MIRFLPLLLAQLIIGIFTLKAQCPFTPSGVVTNVSCNGGNNGAIDVSVTSTPTGNPSGYCLPTYNNPCGNCTLTWDMIWNFSTNGGSTNISNLQSGCNGTLPNNYSFVNQTVTVNPGQSFNIQVQCGQAGQGCSTTYPQGFRIWVDWNTDGDFLDAGENVWNSGFSGTQMFFGTITCPANTACGLKRMRVRGQYASVPTDPCNLASFGETEDYNVMVGVQTTYLWSNGATTEDISGLSAGNYTVTITNGNQSQTLSFTVTEPAPVTGNITAGGPTTFCQGGSVVLDAPLGVGLTYQWSNGSTSSSITATQSGLYTVTITAGVGCTASASQQVQVISAPNPAVITPSDTILLCQGSSIQLTAAPANNITWQPGGQSSASITVNSNGTYSVVTTNASGCTSQSLPVVVQVVPPPSPVINASGPVTFCQGGSVTLSSNYPVGNLWSNGATTSSITVSTAGNYSVTVTATGGCSGVSAVTTVTVNSLPVPTITAGGPTSFCQGGSVTLSSNFNSGNQWSNNQNTSSINVTATGSYSLTVTDANGCTGSAGPTNVTVNPLPAAPVISSGGSTTICSGNSVTLTSSYNSGNQWSSGQNSSSITVSTAGNFTVTYTDANGCTSVSLPTTVTVNPTPTSNFLIPPAICIVDNATVTYQGNAPANATYNWDFGGGNIVSGTGQGPYTINFPGTGTYTVSLTVTNNNCTSTITANNITVNPTPNALFSASALSVCEGQSLVFNYTGNAPSSAIYAWQAGTGNITSGGGQGPVTIQFNQPGTTSIGLTVTQGSCVSQLNEVQILVNALPSPTIVNDFNTACDSLTVTFTTPANAVTYNWNLGNGTSANTQTTSTTYFSGNYDVSLSLTDANGCFNSYTAPSLINVYPTPVAAFITTPQITDTFDIELGSITFNNMSVGASAYNWNFGDGITSTVISPSHTYAMPGVYTVQLIASNFLTCADTAYLGPFFVAPGATTFIPNLFTPNKDGRNDIFKVYSTRVIEMQLIIFDRIGEKLFETFNMDEGWDGTFRGKLMNTGVYVYYCKVKYDSGRYEELFGDVTLIR
jgi:gliding motility-associated-like protein